MNDVIIVNSDVPDRCGVCRFATATDCQIDGQFISDHNKRNTDCPRRSLGKLMEGIMSLKQDNLTTKDVVDYIEKFCIGNQERKG